MKMRNEDILRRVRNAEGSEAESPMVWPATNRSGEVLSRVVFWSLPEERK